MAKRSAAMLPRNRQAAVRYRMLAPSAWACHPGGFPLVRSCAAAQRRPPAGDTGDADVAM